MLTLDTEILTLDGWKHYQELQDVDKVVFFDDEKHTFSCFYIASKKCYDYGAMAFNIQSDETNQIVSYSHRCVLGEYDHAVQEASLLREKEYVTILEAGNNDVLLSFLQRAHSPVSSLPYTKTTYASVIPLYYQDSMWQIETPKKLVVAKKDGMIFITG